MSNILFITYYWPPAGGPGVQRGVKFVKYLPDFDFKATVLSVDEAKAFYPVLDNTLINDVDSSTQVFKTTTWEPFEAYSKISGKAGNYSAFVNENTHSFKQRLFRFIRGNFFIPDPRIGWNKSAIKMGLSILKSGDYKAIVTTSPPHSTQLIGLALQQKLGIAWIADFRDPWTDIYFSKLLLQTKLAKSINAYYERKVLEQADAVLVVSEPIKHLFAKKSNKINPDKIFVVPNGFDEADFQNKSRERDSSRFIISYMGNISSDFGIDNFLVAFKKLCDTKPPKKPWLRFIGQAGEGIRAQTEKLNLQDYVEFKSHVPHSEAIEYMTTSDALLMAIVKSDNNAGLLSGKLFEYLGAKRPIIAIAPNEGSAKHIIDSCQAGRSFDYEEVNEVYDYLQELLMWRADSFEAKQEHLKYTRKNLTGQLADALNRVLLFKSKRKE